MARRPLPARPRLGGAGRPLGRARGARLARRRGRRASASSRRRCCSRRWDTSATRASTSATSRRWRPTGTSQPSTPPAGSCSSRTKLPVSAPRQPPRRSASRSAPSTSVSSTRRRASSSASRSARTRPSPTRSRRRTPTSSSRARSSTGPRGAWPQDETDDAARRVAGRRSAAKAFARRGRGRRSPCERSIQAHGGIGFTWEHPLHRFYKRAIWLEGFGSPPRRAASRSRGRRSRIGE